MRSIRSVLILAAVFLVPVLAQATSSGGVRSEVQITDFSTLFAMKDASDPPKLSSDELIVRLRPFPGAPRPGDVVDAVNRGRDVPGGLGIGNPRAARYLLPARLQGRMKDFYDANPHFPRARLERSVVIRYPDPHAAYGILTALQNNPNVEFVELNLALDTPNFGDDSPGGLSAPESYSPGGVVLSVLEGGCESTAGVIPDDPLFAPPVSCDPTEYQWGSYEMRLPEAWQYVRGHAKVLLIDTGLETEHEDLKAFGTLGIFDDWFIGGNFRPHLSYDYVDDQCDVNETEAGRRRQAVHGTHTSGIVGAKPDNGDGVAGSCWDCPLVMASFNYVDDDLSGQATMAIAATALTEAADKGVQVGSMSFGVPHECPPPPGNTGSSAVCAALDNYTNREIALVGASGNDLLEVELPGIHGDVVAAGAIDTNGDHWDRSDDPEGCPYSFPPPYPPTYECGSNYSQDPQDQTLDLVAPGQFILSTVFTGEGYPTTPNHFDEVCGDQYPDDGDPSNDSDGYGACTGTSMSSPYVAGALSLLRTANPLLTRWQLRQVLTQTASLGGSWDQKLGYGVPDVAAAVEQVQGSVDGQILPNRATPMFRLYSTTEDTHLFTTAPQTAVSEIEGVNGSHDSDPLGDLLIGYPSLPGDTDPEARASFWLFTGPEAPDGSAQAMIPLYRLTRDRFEDPPFCGDGGTSEAQHSFGYSINVGEIRTFHTASQFNDGVRYYPEGIEGYIYPTTATPPVGAEKLYRYYDDIRDDWLLLLESEPAPPGYDDTIQTSGGAPNGEWIGWVLPNVDADLDGIPDAWEDLLGTDPQVADSDNDGCSDGEEILGFFDATRWQLSDPLDGICLFHSIFADGFESGNTGAWSSTVP